MDISELLAAFLTGAVAAALIKGCYELYIHKSEEKRAYAAFFLKEKAENFLSLAQEIEKLDDAIEEYTITVSNEELLELIIAFKDELSAYKYIFDISLIREIRIFLDFYSDKLKKELNEKTDIPLRKSILVDFYFVKQRVKQHIPIDYQFNKPRYLKYRYNNNPILKMYEVSRQADKLEQTRKKVFLKDFKEMSHDEKKEVLMYFKESFIFSFNLCKYSFQLLTGIGRVNLGYLYYSLKLTQPFLSMCLRPLFILLSMFFVIVFIYYCFVSCL